MMPDELTQRRQALDLSQVKLAEVLGVNKWTVSAWEQGRQAIPPYLHLALETLERKPKPKRAK